MKYTIKNIKTAVLGESYVPSKVILNSKKPLSVNSIKAKLSQRYGTKVTDFVCEGADNYQFETRSINREYYFIFEETYDEHFSHFPRALMCVNNGSGKPLNDNILYNIAKEEIEYYLDSEYAVDYTFEKVSLADIKKYGVGAGRAHFEDNGGDPDTIKFNSKILGGTGSFTVPFFTYSYPEHNPYYDYEAYPVDSKWSRD